MEHCLVFSAIYGWLSFLAAAEVLNGALFAF
jgi:hypothetical protein